MFRMRCASVTLSDVVYTATIEIRPCVKWSLTRGWSRSLTRGWSRSLTRGDRLRGSNCEAFTGKMWCFGSDCGRLREMVARGGSTVCYYIQR